MAQKGKTEEQSLKKEKFWTRDRLITVGISAIIAILTSFGLAIIQNAVEQKYIAQGISNEIDQLSPTLQESSSNYINFQRINAIAPISFDPLYTKEGLYYVYGKDIYKLNPTLSYDLHDFYSNITRAENIRQRLVEKCFNLDGNPEIVTCNYTFYNQQRAQMHERILHATNDVKKIKPKLNDTINKFYAFY